MQCGAVCFWTCLSILAKIAKCVSCTNSSCVVMTIITFSDVIILSFLCPQLTFVDMIMYVIFREAEMASHTTRWTRVFRPLFLINISEGRQVHMKDEYVYE